MKETPYNYLCDIYDEYQEDVDYYSWAQYIEKLIDEFGPSKGGGESDKLLLTDLGCGTGTILFCLDESKFDFIGIDISEGMLSIASEKAMEEAKDILFIRQDITDIDLYGNVDVFLCLLDTINHITTPSKIKKMFKYLAQFLNPGGIIIFDIVTEKHLKETLGNNLFYQIDENYCLLWENSWSDDDKISVSDITSFSNRKKNLYEREDLRIQERLYLHEDIERFISEAHLELISVYKALTHDKPDGDEERLFYIVKNPIK